MSTRKPAQIDLGSDYTVELFSWNPPPKPPAWDYRDKTRKFIEQNKDRIGIISLGNSICFADMESGYHCPEPKSRHFAQPCRATKPTTRPPGPTTAICNCSLAA